MLTIANHTNHQPIVQPSFDLHQDDYLEFLAGVANQSLDCIVTDPPYSSLNKWRSVGTTTRLKSNGWFDTIENEQFTQLFSELYRVLANNAHAYIYVDQTTMFAVKPMAEAAGFKFWKPLVIDFKSPGMGYHYRSRASYIMFLEKGKRRLNDLGISDVIEAKRVRGQYPTEKPVSVSEILIKQSTNPGDVVCDPFMGSGSTGEAALINGRNFLGNDLSVRAFELSTTRLNNIRLI